MSPDGPTSCCDSNSGSRGSVTGSTGSPRPCAGWVSPEGVCVWGGVSGTRWLCVSVPSLLAKAGGGEGGGGRSRLQSRLRTG